MIRVAIDWDDTCRDNSVTEFKWTHGALQALRVLNDTPEVSCFILTARPITNLRSIHYNLKAHRLHNISVLSSPEAQNMYSKRQVRYDLLFDDCDELKDDANVVQYKNLSSWGELFKRIKELI